MHAGDGGFDPRESRTCVAHNFRQLLIDLVASGELEAGFQRHNGRGISGLSWAAYILKIVGEFADRAPSWVPGITPRHLGAAVARVLANHPEGEATFSQFLEGFAARPK